MSDFLFSTRRRAPSELSQALERYLAPVAPEIVQHDGSSGSLAVARGLHDPPSVVMDDGRFLSVLIGEPIVRIAPESPGLSWRGERRRAVHDLLKSGGAIAWDDHLDGHFAALVVDRETGVGRVVTDLFAFIPVFVSTDAEGGVVIGSHVDAVARAAGRYRDIDLVSAADFTAALTCTFPHTLYRGVEQAMPATDRRFTTGGWNDAGRTFWRPEERNPFASPREAADALREAVRDDVRVVSEGLPEIGLLLSGGEDSRAVLGAVPPGVRVRSFVYADWESREVRIARAVARAHGADFEVGRRAPSHYLDGFRAVAGMIGAHHLFTDVHGYGFHDRLGIARMPVVLGGLSSDSLLKAEYTPGPRRERRPVRVAREPAMREELLAEVDARRTRFRDWLAEFRPESADEWTVLWPFSMRRHGGNLDGNRRLFRSHEVYHATAVVKIAAAVPAAWKVHRRLFHAAMRPFFATTRFVPHAKLRYPAFGRVGNALLLPGLAIARTARGLAKGEIRRRQQPWPKWSSLSASEGAERERRATPLLESPLRDLFAPESIGQAEDAVRGWYPLRQLILLQFTHLTARAGED
ncbi:MAG TPA: asparagine synthase-related protein [Longimicrobium sp.]|nr:asparagine synthase-related protein [Longimicrobium sp.]